MSRSSTSSSSRHVGDSPWRFLARALLCGAPFLATATCVELILWRTGESWPVDRVVSYQADRAESLYGRALISQQIDRYKHVRLRDVAPEIVVLGSSRVMQLPAGLFATSRMTFFNAGGMIQRLADLEAYASDVADGTLPAPRVAVLGVDPWWLFPVNAGGDSRLQRADVALSGSAHVEALREWLKGRALPVRAITVGAPGGAPSGTENAIGIAALQHGAGFRLDGSRQYALSRYEELQRTGLYRDAEKPPVIERIRRCSWQFPRGAELSDGSIRRLIDACRRLEETGVDVVVFLPPFSDECRQELDGSSVHREWWHAYVHELPGTLTRAGLPCRPPLSPRDLGLDDRWMFDGFHPGEPLSALVLAGSLDHAGGALSTLLDLASVRASAAGTPFPLTLGPPPQRR